MRRLLPIILILTFTSCVNKAVPDKPVSVSFSLAEPGEEYFADLPDGILPTELPDGHVLTYAIVNERTPVFRRESMSSVEGYSPLDAVVAFLYLTKEG